MNKFYYDDPLAAAWMAKHFGMKLLSLHTEQQKIEYDIPDEDTDYDWYHGCVVDGWRKDIEMISDAVEFIEDASDKIYIHPDSLHLLEPQVSDIIIFNETYLGDEIESTVTSLYNIGGKNSRGLIVDSFLINGALNNALAQRTLEKKFFGDPSKSLQIIQRNGIAFHWPKEEIWKQ